MSLNRPSGIEKIASALVLATALSGLPGCNGSKAKTPEERSVAKLQLTVKLAWEDIAKLQRKTDLLERLNKLRLGKTTMEWFDNLTPEEARWLFPQAQKGDKPFDFEKEELDAEVIALFYDPKQMDVTKLNITLYQWWYLEHVLAKDEDKGVMADRAKEMVKDLRK
jgi:hypothetical protein